MKKGKECLVSLMLSHLGRVRLKAAQGRGSTPNMSLMLSLFMSFRYNSVLNSCCLRPDLAILPNSDLTEVQAFCPCWGNVFNREDSGRWVVGLCQNHLLVMHLKCRSTHTGSFAFIETLC